MPVDEEIVAEAAPEEGVTESPESATEEPQEPQDGEPRPKGGFQKRIGKLTAKLTQAEQEREYWREQALRTPKTTETPKIPGAKGKPSENDFENHSDYVEALADWKVDQKLAAAKESDHKAQAKTEQQKNLEAFQARQQAFREKTEDFDDVIEDAPRVQLTPAFEACIVESDVGPEIQYYLAQNPKVLQEMNKLSPLAVAREVGKLESRFTSSPSEKTVSVTKAPAPITPVGRATQTSKSIEDAGSYAEFEVRRNAQIAARSK